MQEGQYFWIAPSQVNDVLDGFTVRMNPVAIRVVAYGAAAILALSLLVGGFNLILTWGSQHPMRAAGVFVTLLAALVLFGRRQVGQHSAVLGAFFAVIGIAMIFADVICATC